MFRFIAKLITYFTPSSNEEMQVEKGLQSEVQKKENDLSTKKVLSDTDISYDDETNEIQSQEIDVKNKNSADFTSASNEEMQVEKELQSGAQEQEQEQKNDLSSTKKVLADTDTSFIKPNDIQSQEIDVKNENSADPLLDTINALTPISPTSQHGQGVYDSENEGNNAQNKISKINRSQEMSEIHEHRGKSELDVATELIKLASQVDQGVSGLKSESSDSKNKEPEILHQEMKETYEKSNNYELDTANALISFKALLQDKQRVLDHEKNLVILISWV